MTDNAEKYRLNKTVEQVLVQWVRENCTDDRDFTPSVIWSRQDQNGEFLHRPPDPFVVLNIISADTEEAEYEHDVEDDFNAYYTVTFTLSVEAYDNRQSHGYMNALLKLRQSLSSQRIQSLFKTANLSFTRTVSSIRDMSFMQMSGSQLKAHQDYMFNYIDVVTDRNIGYIERVRASGGITSETEESEIDVVVPE